MPCKRTVVLASLGALFAQLGVAIQTNDDILKPISLISVDEESHYGNPLAGGVSSPGIGAALSPPMGVPLPMGGPTSDPLYMSPPEQSGYPITEGPYDNPGTDLALTPTIPTNTDCTVRPATVIEIQRMRQTAARVAKAISVEVQLMEKRKSYVEQMTAYLNDRIRELNKVKKELQQETKWVKVSNERIYQLAQKEKLAKMQDILACLNDDTEDLEGEKKVKDETIKSLSAQAKNIKENIARFQTTITNVKDKGYLGEVPSGQNSTSGVTAGSAGVAGTGGAQERTAEE